MNAYRPLNPDLDDATRSLLERAAERRGLSIDDYVAAAIRRVAESDADLDAFIKEGIDQADRGELIPHVQVMAELDEMIERHRARCR